MLSAESTVAVMGVEVPGGDGIEVVFVVGEGEVVGFVVVERVDDVVMGSVVCGSSVVVGSCSFVVANFVGVSVIKLGSVVVSGISNVKQSSSWFPLSFIFIPLPNAHLCSGTLALNIPLPLHLLSSGRPTSNLTTSLGLA